MQVAWSPTLGNAIRELKLSGKGEGISKDLLQSLAISPLEKTAVIRTLNQKKLTDTIQQVWWY